MHIAVHVVLQKVFLIFLRVVSLFVPQTFVLVKTFLCVSSEFSSQQTGLVSLFVCRGSITNLALDSLFSSTAIPGEPPETLHRKRRYPHIYL